MLDSSTKTTKYFNMLGIFSSLYFFGEQSMLNSISGGLQNYAQIWLQKVQKQVESNKMYRITICFFLSSACHASLRGILSSVTRTPRRAWQDA